MSTSENERTILIISYDFPPRGVRNASRAVNLSTALARNGWRTIVVSCSPDNYVNRDEDWERRVREQGVEIQTTPSLLRSDAPQGARVLTPSPRIQRMKRWWKQLRQQPDVYAAWRTQAVPVIETVLAGSTVNMMLAVGPPFSDFVLAQEVAEKHGIPFALDYGDTWLDSHLHTAPTPMHGKRALAMEESALRKATMIFTTTRRSKEALLRRFRYLTHEDILIVPHGYDESEWIESAEPSLREYLAELPAKPAGACVITAYQDMHDDATVKMMLKAVRQMCTKNPEMRAKFRLRILGLVRPKHRHLVRKWKLADVVDIRTEVERSKACAMLSVSDVLWYATSYDTEAGAAVIGDYCGAKKPVLLTCPNGRLVETVRELLPVIHTQAASTKSLRAGLEQVIQAFNEGSLRVQDSAKRQACSYAVSTKEMSRLLGIGMKM